jgi:AraC-like DNA-binding protein/mannose-6-phosphate isomerase-like protein (cupin superfamily)
MFPAFRHVQLGGSACGVVTLVIGVGGQDAARRRPEKQPETKRNRMRRPRIIGAALEFRGGRASQKLCYGTYQGDIPDRNFRFNISVIEHNGSFPRHSHEYSELVIVLGGRATHLTDSGNHPLEDGDVFVINPGRRHGFRDARGLRLCNIMYDPRQFLAPNRDLNRMMGYHVLFDLAPRSQWPSEFKERLHLSTADLVHVTTLLSTLQTEFESKADGRHTIIKSTFLLLVTSLARIYAAQKQDHGANGAPAVRMASVISHIQKHFSEPLRVGDLARLAHWSASQFERHFKRLYHTTPVRFITHVRLHEAAEMLKNPNRDITGIALDTGFSSSAFFATQFKRFMGESPSQYRRRKLAELGRSDGPALWAANPAPV